jgi:hypothetical protein
LALADAAAAHFLLNLWFLFCLFADKRLLLGLFFGGGNDRWGRKFLSFSTFIVSLSFLHEGLNVCFVNKTYKYISNAI